MERQSSICIDALFDLKYTIAAEKLRSYTYPWQALEDIPSLIVQIGASLPCDIYTKVASDIWIAKNAHISDSAEIHGPCIIDQYADIRHSAFIRESAIIGKHAVVGNSVEIKNAILFDYAEVPHFNYIGDSILGYKAHMGGGAITSNIKLDKTEIKIKAEERIFSTGRIKIGAFLSDRVEVGCNSVLNPGTIIGRDSRVYPLSSVKGYIPPMSIYKDNGIATQANE